MLNNVSFQINLTPYDYLAAKFLLPHQLKKIGNQCSEVILTIDLRKYSKNDSINNSLLNNLYSLIKELKSDYPHIVVDEIDYSEEMIEKVTSFFFDLNKMPTHDFRGRPYYAYLYGIFKCRNEYVLHIDSDMMFGGGSNTWIQEAVDFLKADENLICCNPLAGYPLKKGDEILQKFYSRYQAAEKAYIFNTFTTRIFLINKNSLHKKLNLKYSKSVKELFSALIHYRKPIEPVESTITRYIQNADLFRLDFLGREPGCWTLHPIIKDDSFYKDLPKIIKKIELGDLPKKFEGVYNLYKAESIFETD